MLVTAKCPHVDENNQLVACAHSVESYGFQVSMATSFGHPVSLTQMKLTMQYADALTRSGFINSSTFNMNGPIVSCDGLNLVYMLWRWVTQTKVEGVDFFSLGPLLGGLVDQANKEYADWHQYCLQVDVTVPGDWQVDKYNNNKPFH